MHFASSPYGLIQSPWKSMAVFLPSSAESAPSMLVPSKISEEKDPTQTCWFFFFNFLLLIYLARLMCCQMIFSVLNIHH